MKRLMQLTLSTLLLTSSLANASLIGDSVDIWRGTDTSVFYSESKVVGNNVEVNDDISYLEYTKKNNRDKGPAVVGIELKSKEDFQPLVVRMEQKGFLGEYLNDNPELFQFLI